MNNYSVVGYRTISSKSGKKYRIAYCVSDLPYPNDHPYNVGNDVAQAFVPDDVVIGDVIRLYYVRSEQRYIYIPE